METAISMESKVVLLGSSDVGKTAAAIRYAEGVFPKRPTPTIGASFLTKTINIEGNKIKYLIWDTAGQDRFRSLTPMYYRGACVAILVFDITHQKSFDTVKDWVEELKSNIQEDIVLVVCGNKLDLQHKRQVKRETAKMYADEIKALYVEISAKENEGVEQMFLEIARKLISNKHSEYTKQIQQQQQLHKQTQQQNQNLYRHFYQQQQQQQQQQMYQQKQDIYYENSDQCCG
ncbi:hypothetical protein DICPUDRAFT_156394 [Dictyostelium purpureum]|uniref:Rab GTPase n=1 Tax=Dictyostelium purpureum TaxID=5786 RepID=F0ZWG5_DICPU|nr:uncharacterized protein DICPUDRAFT_156394 [Dictyostelium purpureum]EGC31720.1 hypothetical protein DICPUDRAFT_156394 [Dictyostelium purpureum]|eukprot:XP_003291754.1 hypothetical protein DICPUDRAFT_156394 [Dictyostelium purpureum]